MNTPTPTDGPQDYQVIGSATGLEDPPPPGGATGSPRWLPAVAAALVGIVVGAGAMWAYTGGPSPRPAPAADVSACVNALAQQDPDETTSQDVVAAFAKLAGCSKLSDGQQQAVVAAWTALAATLLTDLQESLKDLDDDTFTGVEDEPDDTDLEGLDLDGVS